MLLECTLILLALSATTRSEHLETTATGKPALPRSLSHVAAGMISRIAGEALINASDIDVANESIHDRSVELFFEAAQRLNRMGGFVRRTGGAIKVAARKIQETDDLLGAIVPPFKLKKATVTRWSKDIYALGQNTLESRVASLTSKIISEFADRNQEKNSYLALEHLGDVVGSIGDVLQDVANRLAGSTHVMADDPDTSEISFIEKVVKIMSK